jgi:hypothetical protein
MKGIKGQLSSLSITDLVQWIEMNKKTGILLVSYSEQSICFCFKAGKLLLVSSKTPGARFGDFLVKEGHLSADAIREVIATSHAEGASFIANLVQKKLLPKEFLTASLRILAENNIIEILSWPDGFFEFLEELPPIVADSPVNLNAGFIVFEAVRKYDEVLKTKGRSR